MAAILLLAVVALLQLIPRRPTVAAPNDLITPGTLTVGSDTTYPPQEYIDTATNQATGFDVDLITAIGKQMGLQTKVVTTSFDTIINSLVAKRFDVVISAVSVTPDRQKKVDFVPYFNAGESLLVKIGNPMNIKSTTDLCGQKVGVQNGTIEQTDLNTANTACKNAGKSAIEITALDKPDRCYTIAGKWSCSCNIPGLTCYRLL